MASHHHDDELGAALARLALAGDGIVLGIGLGILAIRTIAKFRFQAKALELMEEAPKLPIQDLAVAAEVIDGVENAVPPIVFVRGKVASEGNEALFAQNSADVGVFIERTQTYLYNEWRGIFGWGAEWSLLRWGTLKEQVSASTRKVPFVLADDSGAFVRVNLDDVRHPMPLVTVYNRLTTVQASPFTFLQAFFGRRYPVGVVDEEKILPLGREITAVGHLSATGDGHFSLKSCDRLPFFLSELDKNQLLEEVEVVTATLGFTGVVLSGLAVGVLGYALFKNWFKWKSWRQERRRLQAEQREEQLTLTEEEQDAVGDVPDGELCVVCLLRRRRAAFVSCGHRVCCMSCARRVQQHSNSKCPVCRQDVTGVIRIYDT